MITVTFGLAKRDPIMKTVERWIKYRDGMRDEQKKWDEAVKKVQKATADAKNEVKKWNDIAAAHTLPAAPDKDGIDLTQNAWDLAMAMPDYRNKIQEMVNVQVKAGGVTVIQGPVVPLAPTDGDKVLLSYFNYPSISSPVLAFNLGNVTVQGTYQQITDNVRAWKQMPHFLAVADGLRLQGTSPRLTGNYAVTIVGFVAVPKDASGASKGIFPPLPENGRVVVLPTPAGANPAQNALNASQVKPGQASAAGKGPQVPGRGAKGG